MLTNRSTQTRKKRAPVSSTVMSLNPDQITVSTREGYDGDILSLKMAAGRWGPFFHVTRKCFLGEDIAQRYRRHARFSRTRILKRWLRKKAKDPNDFDLFLLANADKIEMDATFSLLEPLKSLFAPEHYATVDFFFKLTSRERWLGLTRPIDCTSLVI